MAADLCDLIVFLIRINCFVWQTAKITAEVWIIMLFDLTEPAIMKIICKDL